MDSFEYNLPVKKSNLTKAQKRFLDENYSEAVNIGDKVVEITKNNPFITFEEVCKRLTEK